MKCNVLSIIIVMKNIYLASASPRRKELLQKFWIDFEVRISDIDEKFIEWESPQDMVKRLSYEKAYEVSKSIENWVIISCDTDVFLDEKPMWKPDTNESAYEMLKLLSWKKVLVTTGFTIFDKDSWKFVTDSVDTYVYFRDLDNQEISWYINTNEPIWKAWAFGIQGAAWFLIDKIDWDYYSVIGMPISKISFLLKKFWVNIFW